MRCCLFFFNDTATTEIYTLSLHDALPISPSGALQVLRRSRRPVGSPARSGSPAPRPRPPPRGGTRSEEHTSELQSQSNLVCRLLLEKKNHVLSPGPRRFRFIGPSARPARR